VKARYSEDYYGGIKSRLLGHLTWKNVKTSCAQKGHNNTNFTII